MAGGTDNSVACGNPCLRNQREDPATLSLLPSFTSLTFLDDLGLVLGVAAVVTVLFEWLKQPIVVGYLIAGMIVGPYLPIPVFASPERIHEMANLGVVLLMFAIGLEFNLRKLIRLAPTAGFITVIQVALMMWLGYLVGELLGWTTLESVFVGATISISSTTIVAKAFAEEKVETSLKETVMGVLLAEDLVAVVMLAVLTAIASGASVSPHLLGVTLGQLGVFLLVMVGAGFLFIPWLIRLIARLERDEILLVACTGLCFIFAIIAEKSGYSVALGAFLAGSLVAESGEQHRVEHLVAPLRDVFAAVFFVSVGMMVDPSDIAHHWAALMLLIAAVIFGKFIAVAVASMLVGNGSKQSVRAGMSLTQIGEFSFIIAGLGVSKGVTRDFIYSLAVALSAITTFSTPFMIRASDRVAEYVSAGAPRPLRQFVTLYSAWMEPIRQGRHRARHVGARGPAIVLAIAAAVFAAVVIGMTIEINRLASIAGTRFALNPDQARLAVKLATAAICAILAAIMVPCSRRLATRLAIRTAAATAAGAVVQGQIDAVAAMLQATILLMVALLLLVLVQPFMEPRDGVALLLAAVALLVVVIWRGARRAQGHIRDATAAIAQALSRRDDHAVPGSKPVEHEVAGLGTLTEVCVSPTSAAVGKSLGELELHGKTGAMVLAIARAPHQMITPGDDEVIRAGDVLELAGSQESIGAALNMLTGDLHEKTSP